MYFCLYELRDSRTHKMKIVADHTVPFLKGIAEPVADVTYLEAKDFTPENIHDADALIVRSIDKCTRQLLEGSRVKLITTATIGFDHIDTHYCREAGITWFNAPGCNAESVGLYCLASLITLSLRHQEPLQGKTLGIVGVGHVGSIVERLGKTWGMKVLRNDPPRAEAEGDRDFVSLDTIAREADIITLHVPLTREGKYPTWHLANRDFFRKLARKPWLINSCRGAVHDTQALLQAKKEGKISRLVLDCWENEPNIDQELLSLADLATPHIAGFSADGKANGTKACLQNIERFFRLSFEKLPDVVPPAAESPLIDLDQFPDHRIERAILHAFNPETIDRALRQNPEQFESFRTNYHHPRELKAYTTLHARPNELAQLRALGFACQ